MKKFYLLNDQKNGGDSFDEDLSGLRKKEAVARAEALFDKMSTYDQKRSTFTLFALTRKQYDEYLEDGYFYNGQVIFTKGGFKK